MKALTQVIGTGASSVVKVPAPNPVAGTVVVRSLASGISSRTETTLVHFGRSNLLDKVRFQPEKVKQVLERVATAGFVPTLQAVRDKLGVVVSPRYCQAGVVLVSGDATDPFKRGDRVVTNGSHAETVRVLYSLAGPIPDDVDFEAVAFTPLAATALQGLRLVQPTLGETIVVFGLGLVGQLSVQLVRVQRCRCIALDTDPDRVNVGEEFGATGYIVGEQSFVDAVRDHTAGVGADAVIMTLASDSHDPMHQAAEMSRKRGRIVLVGVTGLNLRRDEFYAKELSFQISCCYGPGRYDPDYEEAGHDYPLSYVRWTQKRNFEAVLDLLADDRRETRSLVAHRFSIEEAPTACNLLLSDEASLGIFLTYPEIDVGDTPDPTIRFPEADSIEPSGTVAALLGAGNLARGTLIPAIRSGGIQIRTIVSPIGVSAVVESERVGAMFAGSDPESIFEDPAIHAVFVLTRHNSHASLVARALKAGKHVFVEKPLALTRMEVETVTAALEGSGRLLTVGFKRRFAALATELKTLVNTRTGPLSLLMTVNAGQIRRHHWTQHPERGGGRIVGEACHFIDLARFLTGAPISEPAVQAAADRRGNRLDDVSHLIFGFQDGSTATIHYLPTGARRFPKERIEAFVDGKTTVINNWRLLRAWGFGRRDRFSRDEWTRDTQWKSKRLPRRCGKVVRWPSGSIRLSRFPAGRSGLESGLEARP